jgi:hypothetical protein
MKDVAANAAHRHLRSLAGHGGETPLAGMRASPVLSPLERAVELARANASDLWAARRGYTACSLEPVVARAYREIIWRMRDPQGLHLVYESIEEAALALQDFLFAHQNRLVLGRGLEGTATTRPLPVWRLHGSTVERGSSRCVDVDVDFGQTLHVGHGPVPL